VAQGEFSELVDAVGADPVQGEGVNYVARHPSTMS
jgi:hypothetical protein